MCISSLFLSNWVYSLLILMRIYFNLIVYSVNLYFYSFNLFVFSSKMLYFCSVDSIIFFMKSMLSFYYLMGLLSCERNTFIRWFSRYFHGGAYIWHVIRWSFRIFWGNTCTCFEWCGADYAKSCSLRREIYLSSLEDADKLTRILG